MGEIDDIFSGGGASSRKSVGKKNVTSKKSKGKSKAADSSSTPVGKVATGEDGKNKKKKRKRVDGEDNEGVKTKAKPTVRQPQTIMDPSAEFRKPDPGPTASKSKSTKTAQRPADLDDFTNSKGNGRSRTEEGYAIYSEAELRIGQGGDTPLCPFDCDCCF